MKIFLKGIKNQFKAKASQATTTLKNKCAKVFAAIMAVGMCAEVKKAKRILASNRGEGFIDNAISILIGVVVGALLLAGLYMLFEDTVLPTLVKRIQEMFNYAG